MACASSKRARMGSWARLTGALPAVERRQPGQRQLARALPTQWCDL